MASVPAPSATWISTSPDAGSWEGASDGDAAQRETTRQATTTAATAATAATTRGRREGAAGPPDPGWRTAPRLRVWAWVRSETRRVVAPEATRWAVAREAPRRGGAARSGAWAR